MKLYKLTMICFHWFGETMQAYHDLLPLWFGETMQAYHDLLPLVWCHLQPTKNLHQKIINFYCYTFHSRR